MNEVGEWDDRIGIEPARSGGGGSEYMRMARNVARQKAKKTT
jgi:hypothetical protein